MAIISLTTIPPRFSGLGPVLDSLLAQTARIDEIRLHLPRRYRRFPTYAGTLPDVPNGVRVVVVEDDFGPASKVLHAADQLRGESVPILFCDDDRIYSRDWAKDLLRAHRSRPDECIASIGRTLRAVDGSAVLPRIGPRAKVGKQYFDPVYRMRRLRQQVCERRFVTTGQKPARRLVARSGYVDLLQGYGGVLVRSDFFDGDCFDIPHDLWMVDDIWLSGHLARRKIPIWLPRRTEISRRAENDPVEALRDIQDCGMRRDEANLRAMQYFRDRYGVWT